MQGVAHRQGTAVATGTDKFGLLDEVLRRGGFWFALQEAWFATGVEKSAFRILVKPDFDALELTGSTATDPQLVEYLIDQLHDRGFVSVLLAEGRNSYDLWLENRDVQILADILGYRYVTPKGRDYEVVDLADEPVDGIFPPDSVLQDVPLSQHWQGADFRILFAKNKTDDEHAFHLCLNNLLSLLPLRDKDYHYKCRLEQADVLVELLRCARVDFCILDAFISNHGNGGGRIANPVATHTLIAGPDLLLTDRAAAAKMGLDFARSSPHRLAVCQWGEPVMARISGDLTPYAHWINAHPLTLQSVQQRRRWPQLNQLLQPWLLVVDHELFPFKDPLNEQINRIVSRYLAQVDSNPQVFWSQAGLNLLLNLLHQYLNVGRVLFWKDRLQQVQVPLNMDPARFSRADFDNMIPYLEALETRALELRADSDGLRWTFCEDGSVLFECSRVMPVDYEDFVRRVDISNSIQYMNDYIGGAVLPLEADAAGRTLRQLERNVYLPQPNYLVLYAGQNIDVSKIESVRYEPQWQKLYWKTVHSENDSARFDDGSVTFARTDAGETLVRVVGRQQFRLPLFWQIVNLDNYPALKHLLFDHAYSIFFTHTMANFEAVYEGRDVRVGQPWDPAMGESDAAYREHAPARQAARVLDQAQALFQRAFPDKNASPLASLFRPYNPQPAFVDASGFAHFKADQDAATATVEEPDLKSLLESGGHLARGFWQDLYGAMRRDAGVG